MCTAGATALSTGHLVSLAPSVANVVGVRISSTPGSGTVPVTIAPLGASAPPVPMPVLNGVVTVTLPPPAALAESITIGGGTVPPLTFWALAVGGIPIDPAAVEQVTSSGVSYAGPLFAFGTTRLPASLQLSLTSGTLTFADAANAALAFSGVPIDLAQASAPILARLKTDDAVVSVAGTLLAAQGLRFPAPSNPRFRIGSLTTNLGDLSVAFLPPQPPATLPSAMVTATATFASDFIPSGITVSGLRYAVGDRLTLCDGAIPRTPVVTVADGLFKGMALTIASGAFTCNAAGVTTADISAEFSGPDGSAMQPQRFPMRLASSGVVVNDGKPLRLITGQSLALPGLTASIATLDLVPKPPLALSGTFAFSLPALNIQTTTVPLSWTALGATLAAGCPKAAPAASGLGAVPHCTGTVFDGVTLNGKTVVSAFSKDIAVAFTDYSIVTCAQPNGSAGLHVSGQALGSVPSSSFSFASLTFTAEKPALAYSGADCGPLGAFALTVPSGTVAFAPVHFTHGQLDYTALRIDLGAKTATIGDVKADPQNPFRVAGLTVEDISQPTLANRLGIETFAIKTVKLGLPAHLRAGHAGLRLDEHGNDIDTFSDDDAIAFTAQNLAFTAKGVTAGGFALAADRTCPETGGKLEKNVAAANLDEDGRHWYHMPWFDVCFQNGINGRRSGVDLVATEPGAPLQLALAGMIRFTKLVDRGPTLATFQAAYRENIFALRAQFDGATLGLGGETMIVRTMAARLEPQYRRIDAEVEIQSRELKNATVFLRHVGFEQTYEIAGTPKPMRIVKTSGWHTKPILDPDLPKTAASFATRYVPDLIALFGARLAGFKL